jgi:Amt family ammonium transporter
MDPPFAILTGLIAGVCSVLASDLLVKMKLDDVVGAVAVHGVCGAWGTLAAGVFLQGSLFSPHVILVQLAGIGACFAWTFGTSYLLFRLIAMTIGVRASTMHEQRGLDITEHEEVGYPEFEEGLIARETA